METCGTVAWKSRAIGASRGSTMRAPADDKNPAAANSFSGRTG